MPAKYASLHPGPDAPAKVPILDDADGTALFESLVVAYYLNDKYPEPALLPSEAAAKAKVGDVREGAWLLCPWSCV